MWAGPSVVKRAYSDMGTKKPPTAWQWAAFGGCFGRGERIRTSGLYVPNVALYQAKLHPEVEHEIVANLRSAFPADRWAMGHC